MALIFVVSALSAPPSPQQVGDKTQHALAYAGLATLAVRATAGGRVGGITVPALLTAWVVAAAYGVSDELHQAFVPGRSADVADAVADALGAAAAVVAAGAFGIIVRSRDAARRS
jgi:VanZ family protein